MDTKLLTYVVTLSKYGSYTNAARELYITPQGLNNAIRRLEESLGYKLFEPKDGIIRPTKLGALFISRASPICDDLLDMQKALNELAHKRSSIIRLGSSPGILGYVGVDAIKEYDTIQDVTTVQLAGGTTDSECEKRLVDGLYDFAMIVGTIDDQSLQSIPFISDYLFAWVNKNNPLSRKPELQLSDLADQDVMFINDSYRYNDLIITPLEREGIHPRMHFADEEIIVYESAYQGECIGLALRNHAEKLTSERTVAVPVKQLTWSCALCYKMTRIMTKSDELFLKHMSTLARFYS